MPIDLTRRDKHFNAVAVDIGERSEPRRSLWCVASMAEGHQLGPAERWQAKLVPHISNGHVTFVFLKI